MLRFSRSKIIATVAIIVIGLLLAVPSTMNREQRQAYLNAIPSWVPSWLVPSRAIVLGLDLQGGSHVLLEVDTQAVLRAQIADQKIAVAVDKNAVARADVRFVDDVAASAFGLAPDHEFFFVDDNFFFRQAIDDDQTA